MAINKNIVQVLIEQQIGKKVIINNVLQDLIDPAKYVVLTEEQEEYEFDSRTGKVASLTKANTTTPPDPIVVAKPKPPVSVFNSQVDELDEDDEEEIRKFLEEENYILPNTGKEEEEEEVKEEVKQVPLKKKRKKRSKNGTGPLNKKHQVDAIVNSKKIKEVIETLIGFPIGGYMVQPKTPGPYRAISVVNTNGTEYIVKFYFESKIKE